MLNEICVVLYCKFAESKCSRVFQFHCDANDFPDFLVIIGIFLICREIKKVCVAVRMLCDVECVKVFTKLNSVALVRERTIPTERPPPVGEVSANFCG